MKNIAWVRIPRITLDASMVDPARKLNVNFFEETIWVTFFFSFSRW